MNVFIIAAVTADGFVARDTNQFAMDWTTKEDVQRFVKLTKDAGVMIMGSRTFATIIKMKRQLPGRKIVVYSRHPESVVYDRADPTEVTDAAPAEILSKLAAEGFQSVAICGGSQIYDLFMRAGAVTDLYLTFEPVLFGAGVPLFAGALQSELQLESVERLGANAIAAHYTVVAS
jgi:dihydrofolate reductase